MAYLTATRYGLTKREVPEAMRPGGWRQVWEHPSGRIAARNPATGHWVTGGFTYGRGWWIDDGFCSSLRAAARRIERLGPLAGDRPPFR